MNGTLVVNTTLTLNNDIIIEGDLLLDGNLILNQATVTINGCPQINGSLTIGLTPQNVQEIQSSGQTTYDALSYSSVCDVNQFNNVGLLNQDQRKHLVIVEAMRISYCSK